MTLKSRVRALSRLELSGQNRELQPTGRQCVKFRVGRLEVQCLQAHLILLLGPQYREASE